MKSIIVGSGYSSAQVFLRLIDKLSENNLKGEVVVVGPDLEIDGMWGRGVAWGFPKEHGKRRLEYLTNGLVQSLGANNVFELSFEFWLQNQLSIWIEEIERVAKAGNLEMQRWLEDHRQTIEARDLRFIFVPRALFGDWISEKLKTALQLAQQNNITVRCVDSVVSSVGYNLQDDNYLVETTSGEKIDGSSVALCTGSVLSSSFHSNVSLEGYFDYLHGYEEEISSLLLQTHGDIAIIGGSASSLDAIRFLRGSEELYDKKIVVISPTGGFPPGGVTNHERPLYTPQLFQPGKTKFNTVAELLSWCREETHIAMEQGYSMETIHMGIRALTDELRAALPKHEQFSFELLEVNRILRRSPEDSLREVRELQKKGNLSIRTGRVVSISQEGELLSLGIQNPDKSEENLSVACCINTSGAPSLRECLRTKMKSPTFHHKSALMHQMVEDQLVELETETGDILIDEHCLVGSTPRLGYIGPQISSIDRKPNLFSAYSWGVLERLAFSFVDNLISQEINN